MTLSRAERFPRYDSDEARVLRNVEVAPNGCWHWTNTINERGYGRHVWRRNGVNEPWAAHRLSYTLFVGPIPDGTQIDHLCHTNDRSCPGGRTCLHRRCVRPTHLEAVARVINLRRSPMVLTTINAAKTHCKRDHEFTPENTRIRRGRRECRECGRDLHRRQRAASR